MSKKQSARAAAKAAAAAAEAERQAKAKKRRTMIIALAAGAVAVAAVVALSAGGGSGSGGALVQPTAEEARYMGRLLPAGYQPPSVGGPQVCAASYQMRGLTATATETDVSIPLDAVTDAKITLFQYEGAQSLPVIAYVKPSGTLFVGVSFCPPCEGEYQSIEADRTLTCSSCGTKRDLESMAGISGACKLYPLDEVPVTIADGQIRIDRAVLDGWTAQPLDRQVG
jgi:hypothetical protein